MKYPAFFAVLLSLLASAPVARAQSTIDPAKAFAWGGNVGWTNWRPSAVDGVVIGEYVCSGFIYCANVGWVSLGDGTPADGIRYANDAANDYGVIFVFTGTPGSGALRGLAYGANIGWINFENTGNARLNLVTGELSGYAWSANCGWINLGSGTQYGVATDTITPGADTDSDGIADAYELENFGDLATASASSDADADGSSDLVEAQNATDPLDPAVALRILNLSLARTTTSDAFTITFTSTTARLYRIEQNEDLAPGAWIDSGLGLFAPDSGSATTRTAEDQPAQRRFYRVLAIRPLAP
ncbi:MAG: hypothetical protein ACR2OZ_10360 [Verrucomicrobiales bacterium]